VEYLKRSIKKQLDAYLDIETTGLSVHDGEITVIGLYLTNSYHGALVQLVGLWVKAHSKSVMQMAIKTSHGRIKINTPKVVAKPLPPRNLRYSGQM
jgi:hypothetical protein